MMAVSRIEEMILVTIVFCTAQRNMVREAQPS